MKKLLSVCLFAMPVFANANMLQFDAPATNSVNTTYNIDLASGSKNAAAIINVASTKMADLDLTKSGFYRVKNVSNLDNTVESTQTAVFSERKNQTDAAGKASAAIEEATIAPASLPLLATAIILFIFGSNRRRV
jgi:hypothetical protein